MTTDTREQYLSDLYAALEVECDLHGSRTRMAFDIRQLITATENEPDPNQCGVCGNFARCYPHGTTGGVVVETFHVCAACGGLETEGNNSGL